VRLNTKCSIALHCLIFLSEYQEKIKVTGEILAKSTGCNPVMIRSIMNALRKNGLITVARGVGGARLVRTPEQITVWDVYQAVDPGGLDHFIGFHPNPSQKCPVGRKMPDILAGPSHEIGEAVRQSMEKITLQQLLDTYHNEEQA
jgi:Rrf2 family protein